MRTTLLKNRVVRIPTARWLAYASASAATALTTASQVEAEIHYSGKINIFFPPDETKSVVLPLDQPGDSISFAHTGTGSWADFFLVRCAKSGAFVGQYGVGFEYAYVFRINKRHQNRYISQDPLTAAGLGGYGALGTMVRSGQSSQKWRWHGSGIGFVGFRFNNGSGNQYGWARVHMDGPSSNFSFTVIDYAWADPGEPIKAGQTSSSTTAAEPEEGSMGLLALGAAGLARWRNRRKA
jgi:MYXO-CTERM domain-containing protein